MKKRIAAPIGAIAVLVFLSGCVSMLPREETQRAMSWKSYEEASTAFDRVVEGKTTLTELEKLGFDPTKVTGSREVDHIVIRATLLPANASIDWVSGPELDCLNSGANARAREFVADFTQVISQGNFFKEKLGFEKRRRTQGAVLATWFCYRVSDEIVLFKRDVSRQPFVDSLKIEKDPLGIFGRILPYKILD